MHDICLYLRYLHTKYYLSTDVNDVRNLELELCVRYIEQRQESGIRTVCVMYVCIRGSYLRITF